MATTVACAFVQVPDKTTSYLQTMPVPTFAVASEDLTTNGSTLVVGSINAPSDGYWEITPTGGDIKIAGGVSPGGATQFSKVLDGRTRHFVAIKGEKIAVKDA